ncbi:MAG: hypothetical protein JNM52_02345, partial [Betaproteobacteria bacterium]|nr:hypothetical protein [Betaproteobacteria bacterium]
MPTISSLTSPRLRVSATIPTLDQMPAQHLLVVIPKGFPRERVLASAALSHILTRQKSAEPPKVVGGDAEGHLLAWVEIDLDETVFQQQTLLRKAVDRLFKESPRDLAIVIPPTPPANTHARWRGRASPAPFVAAAPGHAESG